MDQEKEIIENSDNNIETFSNANMADESGDGSQMGARPKQYSNVIVDDSPLQNQMERNKECKIFLSKF